jgi:hypothetical protein
MALLAYLVVTGPGAVSLDALIARRLDPAPLAARPTMRPARLTGIE